MRAFALRVFAIAAVIVLGVAAINLAVDPYGVFGTPRIAGFNAVKTRGLDDPNLLKTYLANATRPRTLLLGSSRVELGFDPDGSLWPASDRPVFNFGMAGRNARAFMMALRHVAAAQPPGLVVLGLTFEDTVVRPELANSTSSDGRLRVTADGRPNYGRLSAVALDYARMLISIPALQDSLNTVLDQRRAHTASMSSAGHLSDGGFITLVHNEGAYRLFEQKDAKRAAKLAGYHGAVHYSLSEVRTILAVAHNSHMRVLIAILPDHIDDLILAERAGLFPLYAAWKRDLASMIADARARGDDARLWDFETASPWTIETIPPRGVKDQPMRWWWETQHFREALGNLMLARMLGKSTEPFGQELTPEAAATSTAELCRGLARYSAAEPARVAALVRTFDDAALKAAGAPASGRSPVRCAKLTRAGGGAQNGVNLADSRIAG